MIHPHLYCRWSTLWCMIVHSHNIRILFVICILKNSKNGGQESNGSDVEMHWSGVWYKCSYPTRQRMVLCCAMFDLIQNNGTYRAVPCPAKCHNKQSPHPHPHYMHYLCMIYDIYLYRIRPLLIFYNDLVYLYLYNTCPADFRYKINPYRIILYYCTSLTTVLLLDVWCLWSSL